MPNLNELKTIPIIPKYPKKISLEQFRKEITLRLDRLELGLNDLRMLVFEYLDQD